MRKAILTCLLISLLLVWPTAVFATDSGTPEDVGVQEDSIVRAESNEQAGAQDENAEQAAPIEPVYYRNDVYLVTEEQHAHLEQKLADTGETYGIDAVILFVETTEGERLSDYAERVYEEGVREGIYRKEGIVLIFSRAEKQWSIYTTEERARNLVSNQDKNDLWAAYLSGEGPYGASLKYIDALAAHLQAKGVKPIPEDRLLPRLVDEADLFTAEQEAVLLAQLDELSERQKCDVIIVTVPSIGRQAPMAYADDFYDYNGYGYGDGDDGILYLLSMEFRDQAYSTYGFAIPAFTDAGQKYIFAMMKDDLKKDDWNSAFAKYIPLCDEFLTAARNGDPMDIHNLPATPEEVRNTIIALCLFGSILLAICILVARSIVGRMVRKTSSGGVVTNVSAYDYQVPNSLYFVYAYETFIDKKVSKTRKPVTTSSDSGSGSRGGSSTHTSSSGRSHGGSSNKF